jgi:hypothetical protein
MMVDEFTFDDDAVPEPTDFWGIEQSGQAMPLVEQGVLYVGVGLSNPGGPLSYWLLYGNTPIPQSGAIGMEVVQPPATTDSAEAYVGINDTQRTIYLSVSQGEVYAASEEDGVDTPLQAEVYVPGEHRWLRLVFDAADSSVEFQTSPDGLNWDSLGSNDVPGFDFAQATFEGGIGAWEGPVADPERTAAMDNLFTCVQ